MKTISVHKTIQICHEFIRLLVGSFQLFLRLSLLLIWVNKYTSYLSRVYEIADYWPKSTRSKNHIFRKCFLLKYKH